MKFGALAKVLGNRSATSLIQFLFGDEATLEIAQEMDMERMASAVNSETNMVLHLKKAGLLLTALQATRAKLLSAAQKVASEKGPEAPALKEYAIQIADLDKNIHEIQLVIDKMTEGRETARQVVDSIQRQVSANLINDQLTLTKKALNEIMDQQVQFTEDMVNALPKSNIGSALRDKVEKDVEDQSVHSASKLEVLQRLLANQEGAAASNSGDLDDAGEAALAEILGK